MELCEVKALFDSKTVEKKVKDIPVSVIEVRRGRKSLPTQKVNMMERDMGQRKNK